MLSSMKDLLMDARSISEVWHAKFIHNSSPQAIRNEVNIRRDAIRNEVNIRIEKLIN